jgi:uncharacterized damage-inducible protein DinB
MVPLAPLFDHLVDADRRSREALDTLDPESRAHARAVEIFAHLAASEHVWLARLQGGEPTHSVWPELDADEALQLAADSAAGLAAVARSLDLEGTMRTLTYRNSAGREFTDPVGDILLHLALHGSYHRGQIALLVRDGGGSPASTDYIAFVRGAPAP